MVFTSLNFLLFLGVVWLTYQVTPDRWRWLVLLLSSIVFYAFLQAPLLIAALLLVIAIAYIVGHRIANQSDEGRQRRWLWAGIASNILILCIVRYAKPIASLLLPERVAAAAAQGGLFVTIGVSYFTLQAISYLVDVYLKEVPPETHCGRLALYLSFFPKLLQGPIERAGNFLPQLDAPYTCSYDNMRQGALLFTWGFFKKAAVANRLAAYVAMVYGDVHSYNGMSLLLATYFYSLQIYADFSGYTDMALGAALFFNIRLTPNFNGPYLATSVSDFWRRWHMSFSRWILDYIFQPLQILWRRWKAYGTAAALLVTFLLSGLWHGAAWGFVVWGGLHGTYLATSILWRPWKLRVHRALGLHAHERLLRFFQICITFNLVTFAWIFFRAATLSDGWYIATHLFAGTAEYFGTLLTRIRHVDEFHLAAGRRMPTELLEPVLVHMTMTSFMTMVFAASLLMVPAVFKRRVVIQECSAWCRFGLYYLLLLAVALLSAYDEKGFVYFQF